ncbi:hypothetical protein [Martelella alba]|uniref:hypothetical protein n=1 Tax=Martelella alba TaxID=2590451 RepID=UPI0015E84445|nr:hypothetical protein [Martelella alba]
MSITLFRFDCHPGTLGVIPCVPAKGECRIGTDVSRLSPIVVTRRASAANTINMVFYQFCGGPISLHVAAFWRAIAALFTDGRCRHNRANQSRNECHDICCQDQTDKFWRVEENDETPVWL